MKRLPGCAMVACMTERSGSAVRKEESSLVALALLLLPGNPKCCGYSMNLGVEMAFNDYVTKSTYTAMYKMRIE